MKKIIGAKGSTFEGYEEKVTNRNGAYEKS